MMAVSWEGWRMIRTTPSRATGLRPRSRAILSGDLVGAEAAGPRVFAGDRGACVEVRVIPSARRTECKGLYGRRLKLTVEAPPEENRANRQVEEVLAGWLGVTRTRVTVVAGHTSRDKVVGFAGMNEAELAERLKTLLESCESCRKGSPGGPEGA